jgi:phosphoglucosamine mutase
VLVLAALRRSGRTLEEAAGAVEKYPQRLVSVPARRDRLAACQPVWDAVAAAEAELGRDGRVVLRASGTEELVRVMVEAPDDATCQRLADGLVEIVRRELAPAR